MGERAMYDRARRMRSAFPRTPRPRRARSRWGRRCPREACRMGEARHGRVSGEDRGLCRHQGIIEAKPGRTPSTRRGSSSLPRVGAPSVPRRGRQAAGAAASAPEAGRHHARCNAGISHAGRCGRDDDCTNHGGSPRLHRRLPPREPYAACLLSPPGSPAVNSSRKRPSAFLPFSARPHLPRAGAAALATGPSWPPAPCGAPGRGRSRTGTRAAVARARQLSGRGTVREGRRFMNPRTPDRNIVLTKHFGMAMTAHHDRRLSATERAVVGGSGSGKTRFSLGAQHHAAELEPPVTDPKADAAPMGHMWRGDGRGRCRDVCARPRQQALLVRGRPPARHAVPEPPARLSRSTRRPWLAAPEGPSGCPEPVQPQVEGRRTMRLSFYPLHHAHVAGEELFDSAAGGWPGARSGFIIVIIATPISSLAGALSRGARSS